MDLQYSVLDSTYKHIKGKETSDIWKHKTMKLNVAKEEKFAFAIMLKGDEDFCCSLDYNNNISYRGLINKIRLDLNLSQELKNNFNISFLGYVKDDNGEFVGDAILKEPYSLIDSKEHRMLWVEGKIPKDFDEKTLDLKIQVYSQKGYDEEKNIHSISVKINVLDICLNPLKDGDFHLDLWQHPSNWARMYNAGLWSEEHFNIIENYIEELASLGQKVITVIVSDFLWAGQGCYKVFENPSNLFEMNMVKIKKDKSGELICDFHILDRYIEICISAGIDREIDLFGLQGNWDAHEFGNPIRDYKDPIRLNYFDEITNTFKYIDSKKDLALYITSLFNHLIEKELWSKVRVISDEPNNPQMVKESLEFINNLVPTCEVLYKSALHNEKVLEEYKDELQEISLSLPLTVENVDNIEQLKENINKKGGKLSYYVCCFPDRLNNFLSSPLIESRLISWFVYYFGLDGFLRWDYAIWPSDPLKDASYKYPNWKAGDMFFVYPGKDMKPIRSVRWENLRFGIQDYYIFKLLEERGFSKEEIREKFMEELLGKKENMKCIDYKTVEMEYEIDIEKYSQSKIRGLEG